MVTVMTSSSPIAVQPFIPCFPFLLFIYPLSFPYPPCFPDQLEVSMENHYGIIDCSAVAHQPARAHTHSSRTKIMEICERKMVEK